MGIVLAEMARREAPLAASCDHRALFGQMYSETTAAIDLGARTGRFRYPSTMRHFDAWFAWYYFATSDAWRAGQVARVPAAWRIAFTANADRSVSGLGDLLLGMNAHISRDLPYVVAALVPKPQTAIDHDFAQITRIIEEISDSALEKSATRFDPAIRTAEIPILFGGRVPFGQLIALWRAESWANGITLRDSTPADRSAVEQRIEATAAARAAAIVAATSYVPLLESTDARDAYCQSHRPGA